MRINVATIPKGLHHTAQGWSPRDLPWEPMQTTITTLKGLQQSCNSFRVADMRCTLTQGSLLQRTTLG